MEPINQLKEELVGQNAEFQRMTDALAEVKQYAVQLEERKKVSREILRETLSVKLKYEEIINQVIESDKICGTRLIEEIIRNTATPIPTI